MLAQTSVAPVAVGGSSSAALDEAYRKVTWRLIPFLMVLWILAWIDRVNIGFAKLQMLSDLKFSETVYGLGAGIFFIGYAFFEVPSNLLLEKIGARATIARITILWGICCIAMMFVTTPAMFYILRFLLGVFEAGFYPGVILYLTYWYPTERRAKAFGLFMSASALAGVLGGPLAGTIMTGMAGVNGWAGWQWVFLLEGIPSIIAGIVTLLYLTDKPEKAHWLTEDEKRLIQEDLERDRAALGSREHRIMVALRDPKVWQFIAIFFCIILANSTLTFFGPTIVKEVGFTNPATVGWIMAVAYLFGGAGMILNGRSSDHHVRVPLPLRLGGPDRSRGDGPPRVPGPECPVSGPNCAHACDRRHHERDPGVLADAEPVPGGIGRGCGYRADQLHRQPCRVRRALRDGGDQGHDGFGVAGLVAGRRVRGAHRPLDHQVHPGAGA